jgi:hypothetical protein
LGKQEKVPRRAGARERIQYNRACKALLHQQGKQQPIADEIRSYKGKQEEKHHTPQGET